MKYDMNKNNLVIENMLRESAESLPQPVKDAPVLKRTFKSAMEPQDRLESDGKGLRLWKMTGRAAIAILLISLVGTGTAFAASPEFRQAVILFLTSGIREEAPIEQLTGESALAQIQEDQETEEGKAEFSPVTIGAVTFVDRQVLDEHFIASYLYSPEYLDVIMAPSGNLLFYTQPVGTEEQRTFYQLADGQMELAEPSMCRKEGSVCLVELPGVMDKRGRVDYSTIVLPEMQFEVEWQQCGDNILLTDRSERFDIASTFGGTQNDSPLESDYDGRFTTMALQGDTEWVVVNFLFDYQSTDYVYPFFFNLQTGEARDPLRCIDLSGYPCITDLALLDHETAEAWAGENHDMQKKITIHLATGEIEEEEKKLPPVEDYFFLTETGEHTVFYTIGTEECCSGYLYDSGSQETVTLFEDAAWGYVWDYGFADTYVQLIDRHYAVYYREPENEVYLMDLTDGTMLLLEGIPASHDVSFFPNPQGSLLCISIHTEGGTFLLAFYRQGMETARYFERELPKDVQESSAMWIGENRYLIQAASQDREQFYLYLYEYVE